MISSCFMPSYGHRARPLGRAVPSAHNLSLQASLQHISRRVGLLLQAFPTSGTGEHTVFLRNALLPWNALLPYAGHPAMAAFAADAPTQYFSDLHRMLPAF